VVDRGLGRGQGDPDPAGPGLDEQAVDVAGLERRDELGPDRLGRRAVDDRLLARRVPVVAGGELLELALVQPEDHDLLAAPARR
jgi:hypothetical protein